MCSNSSEDTDSSRMDLGCWALFPGHTTYQGHDTFHVGDTERCRLSSGSMNPAHAALTGILMDSCCSISLNTQAAWQGGCDVSTKGPTDVPDTATTLSSAAACSPPEPTCLSLRMGFTQTRTQESFPLLPVKWGDPGSAPTS